MNNSNQYSPPLPPSLPATTQHPIRPGPTTAHSGLRLSTGIVQVERSTESSSPKGSSRSSLVGINLSQGARRDSNLVSTDSSGWNPSYQSLGVSLGLPVRAQMSTSFSAPQVSTSAAASLPRVYTGSTSSHSNSLPAPAKITHRLPSQYVNHSSKSASASTSLQHSKPTTISQSNLPRKYHPLSAKPTAPSPLAIPSAPKPVPLILPSATSTSSSSSIISAPSFILPAGSLLDRPPPKPPSLPHALFISPEWRGALQVVTDHPYARSRRKEWSHSLELKYRARNKSVLKRRESQGQRQLNLLSSPVKLPTSLPLDLSQEEVHSTSGQKRGRAGKITRSSNSTALVKKTGSPFAALHYYRPTQEDDTSFPEEDLDSDDDESDSQYDDHRYDIQNSEDTTLRWSVPPKLKKFRFQGIDPQAEGSRWCWRKR